MKVVYRETCRRADLPSYKVVLLETKNKEIDGEVRFIDDLTDKQLEQIREALRSSGVTAGYQVSSLIGLADHIKMVVTAELKKL